MGYGKWLKNEKSGSFETSHEIAWECFLLIQNRFVYICFSIYFSIYSLIFNVFSSLKQAMQYLNENAL